ncbi:MAG TPA: IS66 family transposase [Arenibacter sp.]|nr:IS66 family transposase [Arenibacter sp.]
MARLETLEKENGTLRTRISELEERLARYENPKNSRNSSTPPSKDEDRPKKNQSLRRATGRKPGGQPGHKGNTLKMMADPDHIVELRPDYCRSCGSSLAESPSALERSRQVVDIPPIRAVWTEYRTYARQCGCGCRTVADFPEGVGSPIGYGSNIEGLIGYFHSRQYLPFKRMQEMMNDVFNVDISEGGIHYLLGRFADRITPVYDMIRQRVGRSTVVGTDETGIKVNGDRHWFWAWQNALLTYIAHSATRGKAAIDAHFPDGFPGATLVHDGWRAQIATLAGHHQTCLPHLLRHLNYLDEKYAGQQWANDFRGLLYDAMELDRAAEKGAVERTRIVQRLERLLEKPPDKKQRELYTFYKRMCRERQHLFTFLFIEGVPPDNNASERAIRNVKVKQKISGQFKNERTAQNFAKIRSVIDTTIKNDMNVLEALTLIAKLQPQLQTD